MSSASDQCLELRNAFEVGNCMRLVVVYGGPSGRGDLNSDRDVMRHDMGIPHALQPEHIFAEPRQFASMAKESIASPEGSTLLQAPLWPPPSSKARGRSSAWRTLLRPSPEFVACPGRRWAAAGPACGCSTPRGRKRNRMLGKL